MPDYCTVFRGVDGLYLAARWHDIVTYFYVDRESPANFKSFEEWVRSLPADYPQGTGAIIWVDAIGAKRPPSAEVRAAYAELAARQQHRHFARLSILEVDGFAGATARAVLTGMNMLKRVSFPQRVVQDPQAGLRWLFGFLPPDSVRGTPEEACRFFQQTLADYRRKF